jgi:hypothetical protein
VRIGVTREQWQNGKTYDKLSHGVDGGTGSMLQDSASMLAEQGQEATPVKKKIGKAKPGDAAPESQKQQTL